MQVSQSEQPLVSVIIPVYNRADLIPETLESVIAQTYQNWECIVVDDGSTDNTREVVRGFCERDPRIKLFSRPDDRQKGANSCRNFGFEKSAGDFIKWLDSDDLLISGALECQVRIFAQSNFDVAVGKVLITDKSRLDYGWINYLSDESLIPNYLVGKVSFYVSGPMWRREFLKDKTLFDEDLQVLMDWDFNLRRLYENPRLTLHHEIVVEYCRHGHSVTSKHSELNEKSISAEMAVRKKHLSLVSSNAQQGLGVFRQFVSSQFRVLLANCLANDFTISNELFLLLLREQLKGLLFVDAIRTALGFISYRITGRGCRILG
jgi:glycosyltransferase involved in cell wall biosynthesis